jgi:hypothetical protein
VHVISVFVVSNILVTEPILMFSKYAQVTKKYPNILQITTCSVILSACIMVQPENDWMGCGGHKAKHVLVKGLLYIFTWLNTNYAPAPDHNPHISNEYSAVMTVQWSNAK